MRSRPTLVAIIRPAAVMHSIATRREKRTQPTDLARFTTSPEAATSPLELTLCSSTSAATGTRPWRQCWPNSNSGALWDNTTEAATRPSVLMRFLRFKSYMADGNTAGMGSGALTWQYSSSGQPQHRLGALARCRPGAAQGVNPIISILVPTSTAWPARVTPSGSATRILRIPLSVESVEQQWLVARRSL